jgi:hypothetical protein
VRGACRQQRQVTDAQSLPLSAGDLQFERPLLDDVDEPLACPMTDLSPSGGTDHSQLSALQVNQIQHIGQGINGCIERSDMPGAAEAVPEAHDIVLCRGRPRRHAHSGGDEADCGASHRADGRGVR